MLRQPSNLIHPHNSFSRTIYISQISIVALVSQSAVGGFTSQSFRALCTKYRTTWNNIYLSCLWFPDFRHPISKVSLSTKMCSSASYAEPFYRFSISPLFPRSLFDNFRFLLQWNAVLIWCSERFWFFNILCLCMFYTSWMRNK